MRGLGNLALDDSIVGRRDDGDEEVEHDDHDEGDVDDEERLAEPRPEPLVELATPQRGNAAPAVAEAV